MTSPAIRQIRALFPEAKIDYLTEKLGSHALAYNKNIDKLWVIDKDTDLWSYLKLLLEIRRQNYDLVFDFFSNPRSAQICFASNAFDRIGFAFKGRGFAYTQQVELAKNLNEYTAITKLRLLLPYGGNLQDFAIEYPISEEIRSEANVFVEKHAIDQQTIAFCVVSRREHKLWEVPSFVELANYLIDHGFKLFFVYGPGEKSRAQQVYSQLRDKTRALVEYEMPRLPLLRGVLEHCKMYVGNDGGIKHLAVCAKIPTFTLFGSVHWQDWTPPDSRTDFVVSASQGLSKKQVYGDLTAAQVIHKIKEVL